MLRSLTVGPVVKVPMTCPISRDLCAGFCESVTRAVSCVACVSGLGAAEVLLKRPRDKEGQVVRR